MLTAVNLPGNCKDMFGKRMVNLDILAVAEALQTVGFSAQGAIITSLSAPFNTLGDEGAAAIANLLKVCGRLIKPGRSSACAVVAAHPYSLPTSRLLSVQSSIVLSTL